MSAFLERGRILFFTHGRYADAEHELLRALDDDPHNAEAHALLGLARNRLDRTEEAVASCREAIRLAPDWSYPHYALGYVLEKNNRLDEAASALEEAIRISPHTAYFHSHLGFTRHRQGRYSDALACADEGLRIDGQHVDSLNRRAMALAALGRFEEAETAARTAVSLAPEDGNSLANLGYILQKRDKPIEALGTLREALRLDPTMSWPLEVTVDALAAALEQGRPEAAEFLPKSLKLAPHLEAARDRLYGAAMKPLCRRLVVPLGVVWAAATLGLALPVRGPADARPGVVLGLIVFLGVIPNLFVYRPFVFAEPLAYPLALRDRAARLFLPPYSGWIFAAVAAPFVAAAVAAAVWAGGVPEARPFVYVIYALALPIAAALHSGTRDVRRDMGWYVMAVAGFGGLFLLGAASSPQARLWASEGLFVFTLIVTGFAARVSRRLDAFSPAVKKR
jgi:tetratricopeptide (TPR) repeat protein